MQRILIVDDSRSIRESLKAALEAGFEGEILTAGSLKETQTVLAGLDCASFFLAILDLLLPDAPKGEVVDYVKAMGIPVLVLTGAINPEIRKTILKKDVTDYLLKTNTQTIDYMVHIVKRLQVNKNISVLVVDDSLSGRKSVTNLLRNYRFNVIEAESAHTALEILREQKEKNDIRLVITDFMMPGMDGLEFLRELRKKYNRHDVAVIGLTGYEGNDNTISARFIKEGANDFLTKNFIPEEFYYRVIQALETQDIIRELRDLNKLKDKFIGIAAHDLKNPLGAVISLTRLIETSEPDNLNGEQKEFLGKIKECAEGMVKITHDILDINFIESGHFNLKKEPTSLRDLITRQVEMNKPIAAEKSIRIVTELENGPEIVCDPAWITQAVDNLLSNAIKYSHAGTIVRIGLTFSPAEVRLDVTDQEQGIPEKELSKLFGYFQRLSPKPTGGEKSTGLGLSIVKAVVNSHGGTATVTSSEGVGSTFSFTLPRAAESEITSR